jgi:hypothetical protein
MTTAPTSSALALVASLALALAGPARADADDDDAARGEGVRFEVTITNLTRGQQFTPILVASHKAGVKLFDLGKPASSELATLAEEGNTAPLAAALGLSPDVGEVVTGSGLTNPGATTKLIVHGRRGFGHLSVAAMLIPTNDGFMAINTAPLPRGNDVATLLVPAYDAGGERNDELCASIPGPFFAECGGSGGGAKAGEGEGYVHIHAGIHGIGNLPAATRDWRNPVAYITVRRMP